MNNEWLDLDSGNILFGITSWYDQMLAVKLEKLSLCLGFLIYERGVIIPIS